MTQDCLAKEVVALLVKLVQWTKGVIIALLILQAWKWRNWRLQILCRELKSLRSQLDEALIDPQKFSLDNLVARDREITAKFQREQERGKWITDRLEPLKEEARSKIPVPQELRQPKNISFGLTKYLVKKLPEDWRSDLDELRQQWLDQGYSGFIFHFLTIQSLADICWGWAQIKFEDWKSGSNQMGVRTGENK
jgi:hypothetical protein